MTTKKRDIEFIYSRVRKALPDSSDLFLDNQKFKDEYSLARFVMGSGNQRRALISAGIHGDEPSGVETICSFLENNRFLNFSKEWELTFLPCLNPYGYEQGTRENHEGKDLNRLFKDEYPPLEVLFVKSIFNKSYDVSLELHEDDTSSGYYLYQKGSKLRDDEVGKQILAAVQPIMPINLSDEIDGNASKAGIIDIDQDHTSMDWWPMALYSLSQGTRRCLTVESASQFPMEVRVKAHLQAIDIALEYFSGKS